MLKIETLPLPPKGRALQGTMEMLKERINDAGLTDYEIGWTKDLAIQKRYPYFARYVETGWMIFWVKTESMADAQRIIPIMAATLETEEILIGVTEFDLRF